MSTELNHDSISDVSSITEGILASHSVLMIPHAAPPTVDANVENTVDIALKDTRH